MTTLTIRFRKRGPLGRRRWFLEVGDFVRDIVGEEKFSWLHQQEEAFQLHLRDFIDLMLTTAVPDCRIHHGREAVEVEIDFDNDHDAVAFHLRYVNFD